MRKPSLAAIEAAWQSLGTTGYERDDFARAMAIAYTCDGEAMIGPGERLILTGYDDVLQLCLERFVTDAWPARERIEQRITWQLLRDAAVDILPQTIQAMREKLQRS